MTNLPEPLTPIDCDLRNFPFMPLDVVRLRDSDLAALESPEACWAAVLLWCASWHQIPAASLPNDDRVLANLAGFGRVVKEWSKVRQGALRGWITCNDGRLYHPVIAEKALDAMESKYKQEWRTELARIRKHNQRHPQDIQTEIDFETFMSHRTVKGCPIGQGNNVSPMSHEKQHPTDIDTDIDTETETDIKNIKPIVRSATSRFEEFWAIWPKSSRKVAKNHCEKKWSSKKLDAIADSIIQHVTQMKNTKQWLDGFEPAPLTYINQGRWTDEIFTGEGKANSNTKPWYISSTGIEAKAIELGIVQLRDENFTYFKGRVYEAAGITNEMIRAANQDFGRKAA
jgi:hypothetical protein